MAVSAYYVFEVHSTRLITIANGPTIGGPSLTRTIPNNSAYGITALRRIVNALANEEWPLAYRDGDYTYVGLARANNFYQFPARVRSKTTVTGGHEWTVDVYSRRTNGTRCGTTCAS